MKKVGKFIGLGCGLLLLAGCGSNNSNQLFCSVDQNDMKYEVTINFNSDLTEATGGTIYQRVFIPDKDSREEAEEAVDTYCDEDEFLEKCEATIQDDYFIVNGTISAQNIKDSFEDASTYEEIAEELEDRGYSCR